MTAPGPRICSVDGCEKKHSARGYCATHYEYRRRTGEFDIQPRLSTEELFWSKVEKTESCWNWTAYVHWHGYGQFKTPTSMYAHRWSYAHFVGPIPEGQQVDHLCHNRRCVNPNHLRLATNKQNSENLAGAYSNSRSGVRGVSWNGGMWAVRIKHNYKTYCFGSYATIEEASAVAIARRNEIFTHNDADRVA